MQYVYESSPFFKTIYGISGGLAIAEKRKLSVDAEKSMCRQLLTVQIYVLFSRVDVTPLPQTSMDYLVSIDNTYWRLFQRQL
jgi:hypothetical protein